jgi:hypothetical protein
LEKILPKDTILNGFNATGGFVSFKVLTDSKESVADAIVEMKELDYVQSFEIPSIRKKWV